MMKPLLLACTEVYEGPWVPADGLEGRIQANGLAPGDAVVVRVRDLLEKEDDVTVTFETDGTVELPSPVARALIRAERVRSTGAEVFIWVS